MHSELLTSLSRSMTQVKPAICNCWQCTPVDCPRTLLGNQIAWGVAEFRHPAPTNRECAQCHKPPPSHFMEHFKMVSQARAGRKARVDQCSTCHTTDSWNNIRGKGMIDHH